MCSFVTRCGRIFFFFRVECQRLNHHICSAFIYLTMLVRPIQQKKINYNIASLLVVLNSICVDQCIYMDKDQVTFLRCIFNLYQLIIIILKH